MLGDKISTFKMSRPLTVQSGTSGAEVGERVQRREVGCVLVCRGKELLGIMTERDVLMKIVARDVSGNEPVDEFMTPSPITLTPNDTIGDAITLMNRENFRHVPIVDEATGEALAVFTIKNVINFLAQS